MVKKILLFFVIIVVLATLVLLGFIWYNFYDVSGLTLYKDDPIEDIIVQFDKVYIITTDGKGYVAGGYNVNSSRKYLNSETIRNKHLGDTPTPVLFFDGVVKDVFTCGDGKDGGILFTDNENNLYDLDEIHAKKIAENIIYATRSLKNGEIYVVDESKNLTVLGDDRVLLSGVIMVKICNDKVYVLLENGDLCEYSDDGLTEPIFTSVKCFDVVDTSEVIFNGESFVLNDEETAQNPLINVLTEDGSLYAKGSYNLIYNKYVNNYKSHLPYKIEKWTQIGDNVKDFSLAGMGTVMVFNDKTCSYFGFDTTYAEGSEVQYRHFDIQNVEKVCATDCHIMIEGSDGFYFLGNMFDLFFGQGSKEHNILTGKPYVLER